MKVWAIVVAAGSARRFGRPKQFESVGGRTVLERAVAAARVHSDGVVVVLPPGDDDRRAPSAGYGERNDRRAPSAGYGERGDSGGLSADVVVTGGITRSASVRAGLAAVPAEAAIIVVHDAARPLASAALFAAVLGPVRNGADAALPAVPLSDTVRRVGGGVVNRDELLAVQTPQAFGAGILRRAHAEGAEATDDATLVEQAGGNVVVVPGEPTNLKITRPEDLVLAEALLASGVVPGPAPVPLTAPETDPAAPDPLPGAPIRLGHGFDVHPFATDPTRPLVLGGVRFDDHAGLAGHSDADVVAHAVTDALLGAAGLGDIGELFPDTDPAHAGADSLDLLAKAVRRVRRAGWTPGNVDCTVVAESPRLSPRRAEMEGRLGAVVGAPVSVKGKRAEGLGALGRREGIACWAVAVLVGLGPS